MLCHVVNDTRPTAEPKDTECRKGDIVAKQSDCIVSSRKTNITGRSSTTRISPSVGLAAAEALGQMLPYGKGICEL